MRSKTKELNPNQIRVYRRRRNLRLREVAALAGLKSASHVSHWEKGRKIPTLTNALKLSAIINCPVEVLFFDLFNSIRHGIRGKAENTGKKS